MRDNAIVNYSTIERKNEIVGVIIFAIINIIMAYTITSNIGIANTVIHHSYCLTIGDITWEVVIFMILSFVETLIYDRSLDKLL